MNLSTSFLHEILRLCFSKKTFLGLCVEHIKFQYIPVECVGIRKIFKSIVKEYLATGNIMSFGAISQQHVGDEKVQKEIEKIKKIKVTDLNVEIILVELEDYIKKSKFQLLHENLVTMYNEGRQNEAIQYQAEESAKIVNFSIKKGSSFFTEVFASFEDSLKDIETKRKEHKIEKLPFGIPEIDEMIGGGMDETETALLIASSGFGKSTFLRYVGFYLCIYHKKDVLHLQFEGSLSEARSKYHQMLSGEPYNIVRSGDYPKESLEKMRDNVTKLLAMGKDITIYAAEQFDDSTMLDVRTKVHEYQKIKGKFPDVVLIDSLDLLLPGDGHKYGVDTQSIKMKKTNVAKKMKNLAIECNTRVITVDQVSGLSPDKLNDPDFMITRFHAEGDRTLIKPFSFVFTYNQTNDEKKNNKARLYIDKFRNYKISKQVIHFYTQFDKGKFYDAKRTKEKILDV